MRTNGRKRAGRGFTRFSRVPVASSDDSIPDSQGSSNRPEDVRFLRVRGSSPGARPHDQGRGSLLHPEVRRATSSSMPLACRPASPFQLSVPIWGSPVASALGGGVGGGGTFHPQAQKSCPRARSRRAEGRVGRHLDPAGPRRAARSGRGGPARASLSPRLSLLYWRSQRQP